MKRRLINCIISVITLLSVLISASIPCFAYGSQTNDLPLKDECLDYASMLLWGNGKDSESAVLNVCNRINNSYNSDDSSTIESCGTIDLFRLQNYILSNNASSSDTYSYINSTYNSLISSVALNSRTEEYVVSYDGHFRIYYDSIPESECDISLFMLMGIVFDAIRLYFTSIFDFNDPLTGPGYYSIVLKTPSDFQYGGMTSSYSNGYSYITMRYDYLQAFGQDSDCSYILGVAAHEYMHAILCSYGVPTSPVNYAWFHESMARAAGIFYEVEYANLQNVCNDINSFLGVLDTPISQYTGDEEGNIRNGSCVFFLFLCDEFDEWYTIKDIVEQINYESDLISAVAYVLRSEYSTAFSTAFGNFMVYNTEPDVFYSSSPQNNSPVGSPRSWGSPPWALEQNISWIHTIIQPSTCSGLIESRSANYLFLKTSSNFQLSVSIVLSFSQFPNSTPYLIYGYYRDSNGTIHSLGTFSSSPIQRTITMSANGNNRLYFVLVNTGSNTTGLLNYSVSIHVE